MMHKLPKLKVGDKVAILSPSFAAPGRFSAVYEFGLSRVREVFGLEPVEFPTTKKLGASREDRARDLIAAFENPDIKAVIATIGGDDQVTYIKNLPSEPFINNPKPFFGFSDNSHFANFLFLNDIPSYYGAAVMTQFAMQGNMDPFTITFIKRALFDEGKFELIASDAYSDQGLNWDDTSLLTTKRQHWPNEGHIWDGDGKAEGLLWGGCVESVDEMLRHGVVIPTLEQFENIILMLETSEEIPSADYVSRILRAFGERGILGRARGVVMGRAKAWEFDKPHTPEQKEKYRKDQQEAVLRTIRKYNQKIPIVQNMNFGHTDPQIPMPYGGRARIDVGAKKIFADF
ncbi:TPA: LD-carboxypeptidase [Patescibacteria group bacterium]|nr:MAG: Peptidase U61 LD-carboxypeptidase A [Parcubacteria group bacterium GW2011_GWF2_40_10]KKR48060.1 MAG: Peptidase U61 LD-carboxypeptidase A [Parcubacteria group bacterium GW2011_GWA2_40_143]KKR60540.1 MAG: Peptidase U61 LD-carboxypeptidase A [Parcubacteria group bacterium GW2011_GWC2_40_31]KKR75611.1 MAG: Peptidase U61 LD-carboxypeptidase A [Parcubacteria group bacterium GW2011_GWB2_40_8]KKR77501.1 MAG: Peptidase U61 LD-carboxypeptidase A [Parcubacteria group bacterium GW2011_GWE2_40_8]KK